MNVEKLKETRIVSKEGNFLPLVFIDLSIPAAYVGVATTAGARNFKDRGGKGDGGTKKFSSVPTLCPYCLISVKQEGREQLINSIDDILF